jgi:two-component system, NtrC family, nitrogen regulation sensor histidine kinase GlnL
MNDTAVPLDLRRAFLLPGADKWFDALPLPIIGVDSAERIRMVNVAAADLLAPAGRGLVGKRMSDVFGADAALVDLARRALTHAQTMNETDVLIEGPTFSIGRADVWAAPVEDDRFAAIAIIPRSRARAGIEARPNSAVAKTLAHEVRNPLAGIRAAAQLIPKSTEEEIAPLTDLIIDEVDRIRRLTDRIGALDGLAAPKMGSVNVHQALERVRKIVASTFPQVIIKERYDPSLPHVRADLDQMIQAFLNIAKNAAEAARSKSDGAIMFATAYRPGVRIRAASGATARAQLEVMIEDNGDGIAPATQARLFEPFVTTKMGGMGLGLAISAEIVARHNGRIECESVPGRTVFRVLLPIDRVEDAS